MKLIDFIITVFTMVDNFCKRYFPVCKLRKRGFKPKLADSEVITMEIIGEFKGFHEDKGIYRYFKQHWLDLFPKMPYRSNFVRQAASLWKVKERFFEYLQTQKEQWLQIVDSMPIEVCKFVRAKYTKLFKGLASYGKWFGQTFFGYKLHLKISRIGIIRSFIVANIHDITCVEELVGEDNPRLVLGDKGYRSESLRKRLWQQRGIYVHTSLRRNDAKTSPLPKLTIRKLTGIRRLVETVAGQLEQQFSIKRTFARNPWHLFNRIIRKIVSHTFGVFLNLKLNRDPLKLKSLIC